MGRLVNHMLADIEQNIASRKDTDRGMWFSMWILLSFVTFGAAWFVMIYYLIKRRNEHFARQKKLEHLVLTRFRQLCSEAQSKQLGNTTGEKSNEDYGKSRNALQLTALTLLILPTFHVLRFLMEDLRKHEEHESVFLREVVSYTRDLKLSINLGSLTMATKSFELGHYLVLTLGTLGFAGVYWLYLIFNDYNRHFKRQWIFEDELLKTLKPTETSKAKP
jgi:hypothetical protein